MTDHDHKTDARPRLWPYEGRILFLRVRTEAAALLCAGHSCSAVWRSLCDKHDLSISYAAFRRNMKVFLPDPAAWLESLTKTEGLEIEEATPSAQPTRVLH